MVVTSLDKIVRNLLVKRKYPIHYYLDFLVGAKECIRELTFDGDLKNPIRYAVIPLDDKNFGALPNDYVDYCRVSVRVGQYMTPLVEDNALDLVPNYSSTFSLESYLDGVATETTSTTQIYYTGYLSPYWWLCNWNAYGENLGRQFGGVGAMSDTFKIDRKRNQIKINEALAITEVVLEYISDGQDADSATHIDAYAEMTVQMFAIWQHTLNHRSYNNQDKVLAEKNYTNERQRLRARQSDLSMDLLKRIVQRSSIAVKY